MTSPALPPALANLAKTIITLQNRIAQLERNQRTAQLSSTSIEGGTLIVNDPTGTPAVVLGVQSDGSVTAQTVSSYLPPQTPDAPTALAGVLSVWVVWDGLMTGGVAPLLDFQAVQVHCSTVSGFTPSAATLAGTMHGAGLFVVGQLTGGATYYVQLVAVNDAGTTGTPSPQATAVAGTVASNITAGTITAELLAAGIVVAGIVDATTITAAEFLGAQIISGSGGGTTWQSADPSTPGFYMYYDTGTGNPTLIFAVAAAAGSDQWGGTWQAGITFVGLSSATNTLTIENTAGATLAGIDSSGNIQGQTLSAATDVVLAGQSLTAVLSGLLTPNPWIPMTLVNGASAAASPNGVPAYQLSIDGTKVYIAGVVGGVQSATKFATLPAGYFNPTTQTQFPVAITSYSTAPTALPYIQVDTSGNCTIQNAPGGGAMSTVVLSGFIDMTIPVSGHVKTVSTFYPAQTWCFYGSGALSNTGGTMVQGLDPHYPGNGVRYSYMDFSAVGTTITAGATIHSATLRLYCQGAYYSTGIDAALFAASAYNSSALTAGVSCLDQWPIYEGQILTHTLAPAVMGHLTGGYPYLVLGANTWQSGSSSYSGYFYGAGGSDNYMPCLTVSWTS